MSEPTFPLIEIEGPPRERGRMYGRLAADRIAMASGLYYGTLKKFDLRPGAVRELADRFLVEIEAYDRDSAEELRGISEGSGLALEEVVVVNARRELVSMAGQVATETDDECTAAVVLPELTGTGELFHGQNWDTSPEHAEHCLVLLVRQEDGPDLMTFTEAGQLARSGFNAAGIAITGNHLACDRDYLSTGVPLPLIRRKALSTPVYALAISTVYATRKSGSNNMIVSHAQGEAINIECAPDESFLLHPRDGILTHANHWESIPALCKLRDVGATNDVALAATPCSTFRSDRTHRLLQKQRAIGPMTFEGFRDVFLDDFGSPYSICRPPRPVAVGVGMSATAATVVMNAGAGYMDVAGMPAVGASWTRYCIDGREPQVLPSPRTLVEDRAGMT